MKDHLPAPLFYMTAFDAVDIDSLIAIEKTCFKNPWRRESFENELQTANAGGYVARIAENKEVTGYILFRTVLEEMHILKLATGIAWRNQNIASSLIQKALETARARRLNRLFLEVRASNKAAIGVYLKNGFAIHSIRKGYYPSGDHALLMALSVKAKAPDKIAGQCVKGDYVAD